MQRRAWRNGDWIQKSYVYSVLGVVCVFVLLLLRPEVWSWSVESPWTLAGSMENRVLHFLFGQV